VGVHGDLSVHQEAGRVDHALQWLTRDSRLPRFLKASAEGTMVHSGIRKTEPPVRP
jgi:hypothetical protein